MSTPNWSKLYRQGRCKAIGVSFTDEEMSAVYHLKIPAEYVRDGILTREEYEKVSEADKKVEDKTGRKPLERISPGELRKVATDLEVEHTKDTPHEVLRELVSKKEKTKAKKKEVKDPKKKEKSSKK